MRVPLFDKGNLECANGYILRSPITAMLHVVAFAFAIIALRGNQPESVTLVSLSYEKLELPGEKYIPGMMSAIFFVILVVVGTYAKPLNSSSEDSMNKIDQRAEVEIIDQDQDSLLTSTLKDAVTESSYSTTSTSKPGLFSWLLTPLTQNLQINPQTLQNRVAQFKETLSNLGLRREDSKGKQLSNANNLLQLVGANDSGFYTNRLEPAGFFGGNGWLANKGGILGGPGAILSTGSILTDYPTAYRRK